MLKRCEELVNDLNHSEVAWVLYKGRYHYLDGFDGDGDIDLFVSSISLDLIHDVLRKHNIVKVKTQKYSQRNGVEDWIGFDNSTGRLFHIHLHTKIVFGNTFVEQFRFNLENESLKFSQVLADGVHVQNPIIESVLVISMYAKKCISIEKLNKYRGGVLSSFDSSLQNKEISQLLTDSEIKVLEQFASGALDLNSNLSGFANRFCKCEVRCWRYKFIINKLLYRVSHLLCS